MNETRYDPDWLKNLNKAKVSWRAAEKFKFFQKQKSDKLIIVFTGQGKSVMFDFYKTFGPQNNINSDTLFFCDINDGFYLNGIQGYSMSPEETCERISDLWNTYKYKQIIFIGTSMGGFAAIMHALYLKNTKCKIKVLVFNPYTEITNKEYKNMLKKIRAETLFYLQQRGIARKNAIELILNYQNKYLKLKDIINDYVQNNHDNYLDNSISFHVVHGTNKEEMDRVNNLKELKNIFYIPFEIKQHNIAGELKKQNLLLGLIDSTLELSNDYV